MAICTSSRESACQREAERRKCTERRVMVRVAVVLTFLIDSAAGFSSASSWWHRDFLRIQTTRHRGFSFWVPPVRPGAHITHSTGSTGWPVNSVWDKGEGNNESEEPDDADGFTEEAPDSRSRFTSTHRRAPAWQQNQNYGQQNQALDIERGSNPAGLPEIQLDSIQPAFPGNFVRRSDRMPDSTPALETTTTTTGAQLFSAGGQAMAVEAMGPGSIAVPIKAMFFVDGTWLFYSFFSRGRFRCPIINKFGDRWRETHRVDWGGLRDSMREAISSHLPGRLVDVIRVVVFGSVRRDTHPSSARIRMFKDMQHAGFEVHLLTHNGEQEKCVDISLAVEMMHYASVAEGYEVGALVTGDKDFMPAMSRVRQKGKRMILATVRTSCNRDLLDRNKHVYDFHPVLLEDFLHRFIVPKVPDPAEDEDGWHVQQQLCDIVLECLSTDEGGRRSLRDVGRFLQTNSVQGHNALALVRGMFRNLRSFLDEWPDLFTVYGNDLVLVKDKDVFGGQRRGAGEAEEEEEEEGMDGLTEDAEEYSSREGQGGRRHRGREGGRTSWTIKRVGRADIRVGGRKEGGRAAEPGGLERAEGGAAGESEWEGSEDGDQDDDDDDDDEGAGKYSSYSVADGDDGEDEEEEMGLMVHPSVLPHMKVQQLRQLLRERGCKVSGSKQELVDRLLQDGFGAPSS